jgi:hypothetical protein
VPGVTRGTPRYFYKNGRSRMVKLCHCRFDSINYSSNRSDDDVGEALVSNVKR